MKCTKRSVSSSVHIRRMKLVQVRTLRFVRLNDRPDDDLVRSQHVAGIKEIKLSGYVGGNLFFFLCLIFILRKKFGFALDELLMLRDNRSEKKTETSLTKINL